MSTNPEREIQGANTYQAGQNQYPGHNQKDNPQRTTDNLCKIENNDDGGQQKPDDFVGCTYIFFHGFTFLSIIKLDLNKDTISRGDETVTWVTPGYKILIPFGVC